MYSEKLQFQMRKKLWRQYLAEFPIPNYLGNHRPESPPEW